MNDPVTRNHNTGKFQHSHGGRASKGFDTKAEAGKDYVKTLVQKEPKYKPLFEGKTWAEIFKLTGVNV